jgi:phosphohistidine phosphatase SixA
MDLYLLRPGAGLSSDVDPARPLSPVARDQAATAARALARLGVSLEAVACAATLRAAQSAKLAAEVLGFPEKAIRSATSFCPTGQVEEAMDSLAALAPAQSILCCCHAPLAEHLASTLVFGGPAGRVRLEPGGLTMLEVPELPTRAAILRWHLPPALLRLLASS